METAKPVSRVIVTFGISTSSVWEIRFLCISWPTLAIVTFFINVWWDLIVFFCITMMMVRDMVNIFVCLLTISWYISSLVKCLLMYLVCVLIGLFAFYCWVWEFLYILDMSAASDMWFAKVLWFAFSSFYLVTIVNNTVMYMW